MSATREVWVKDGQGNKTRVTRAKRVRSWFWLNTDGKWLLEVRYGSKVLELQKGKRAIEVGARGELPAVIGVIQEAVRAGELDAQSGPDPAVHGVVRWRLVDLVQWLWDEFQVSISEDTVGRELRALGYRKLTARPRHHAQDPATLEAFKKTSPTRWRKSGRASPPASA